MNDMFGISVKCLPHTEELLASELKELGVQEIEPARRIVHGLCDMTTMQRVCYSSRLALRVLVPLESFSIRKVDDLYKKCLAMEWDNWMLLDQTFAIDSLVRSDFFNHTHFASLKMKDAIADYFRKEYDKRPNVDAENPDVLFHLHVDGNEVTISLDAGGRSLNQRGYRMGSGDAPLNEVLAASLIQFAGYTGDQVFVDPMCGSGTLVIEAAMLASNTPAQYNRPTFQFMKWPTFKEDGWLQLKATEDAKIKTPSAPILASDFDDNAMGWTKKNSRKASVIDFIQMQRADFFEVQRPAEEGILMMNPPYGERLSIENAEAFYQKIGTAFKHQWGGWKAWVFSGSMEGMKFIGLKPMRKSKWLNAKIECSFHGYELFSGDRKSFKTQAAVK